MPLLLILYMVRKELIEPMDESSLLRILAFCLIMNYINSKTLVPYVSQAQETEYKPSYETYEESHPPHPFHFGYDVLDEHGNKQQRQEEGDHNGHVKGSYGYTDAHGVYRQVDYIADHSGFRAAIQTNEPGTSNEDPADVKLIANPSPQHILEQQYKKIEAGYSDPKLYLKAISKPLYKEGLY